MVTNVPQFPGNINRELFTAFKAALMSESPGEGRGDQANASSASSSNGAAQPSASGGGDDKAAAPIEKTISCVSCRKRKLKCDRIKPTCGTCSRLRHDCEYPERRRNLGSKRRNMKELEARLAQVETQLVSETSKNTPPKNTTPSAPSGEPDWNNYPMDINMDFEDHALLDLPIPDSTFTFEPQMPAGDFFSQEVISLGLQEPLPPDEMIDELHQIYFEKHHNTMPMMHKNRYLAALHLPPHMRPPICLRYAIWTTAASLSDKYLAYEDIMYQRARRYVEQAEMKGHGETFVTIQYAQTWGLISTYEAKKTYFTRAWMSTGRMIRLCHMLGLHRLDGQGPDVKKILPPPKDAIEHEERRRTFWAAFYSDRWASSGTGWPMIIDEKTIMTDLPASEESFEQGNIPNGISLQQALTAEGASQITPFGGVVLSACLFGHNFEHLHQTGPNERPGDLANGEFWKRHRKMDNVLSNTFMFLPDHLRLPGGLRDMNIVFLHMNIHASTICLHQAAIITAEKNKISPNFVRQSRARSLMAAEEIANIMKLISHLDSSNMNSWMGFCLYVASGVFIQDLRNEKMDPQSMTNLEFLLSAMRAIGARHSITHHFTAQVELDIENSGIGKRNTGFIYPTGTTPMVGVMPHSVGTPDNDLCAYIIAKSSTSGGTSAQQDRPLQGILPTRPPYTALPVRSADPSPRESPNNAIINNFAAKMPPNWNPPSSSSVGQARGFNPNTEPEGLCNAETNSSGPGTSESTRISPSYSPLEHVNSRHESDATTSTSPSWQSAPNSGSHNLGNSNLDYATQAEPLYGPFITDNSLSNVSLFPETRNTQYSYNQADEIDLGKISYDDWPSDLNGINGNESEFRWTFDANSTNPMPELPDYRSKGNTPPS